MWKSGFEFGSPKSTRDQFRGPCLRRDTGWILLLPGGLCHVIIPLDDS